MSSGEREEILEADDVRRLLKCSTRMVQKMAREGTLPSFRVGRLHRFRAAAIREWMDKAAHE